jgi:hypothetical protein
VTDASKDDEFEPLSMAASCSMTPPESHFCFDARTDSAFEALEEFALVNAPMGAGTEGQETSFAHSNEQRFTLHGLENGALSPPQSIELRRENWEKRISWRMRHIRNLE